MYEKDQKYFGDAGAILFWLGELKELPAIALDLSNRAPMIEKENTSISKNDWLEAYPNPADKVTFINYPSEIDGKGEIKITNTLGQEIYSIVPNTKGLLELDVSDFEKGMYIVTITFNGNQIDELKLIKK